MDAYAAMGMEFGSSLADVTAAFRQKAKQLHPDSNNGDRSAEPELRRMLEASVPEGILEPQQCRASAVIRRHLPPNRMRDL